MKWHERGTAQREPIASPQTRDTPLLTSRPLTGLHCPATKPEIPEMPERVRDEEVAGSNPVTPTTAEPQVKGPHRIPVRASFVRASEGPLTEPNRNVSKAVPTMPP